MDNVDLLQDSSSPVLILLQHLFQCTFGTLLHLLYVLFFLLVCLVALSLHLKKCVECLIYGVVHIKLSMIGL